MKFHFFMLYFLIILEINFKNDTLLNDQNTHIFHFKVMMILFDLNYFIFEEANLLVASALSSHFKSSN